VASQNTRSYGVLAAINRLRKENKSSIAELSRIVGGDTEARQIVGLLVRIGFATQSADEVQASDLIYTKANGHQVEAILEHLFGVQEAGDFRMLMDVLGAGFPCAFDVAESVKAAGPRKVVDEAIVKKYVKGYIDVSDIGDDGGKIKGK